MTWAASVRAEGVVRFPYGEAALAPLAAQDIAAAQDRPVDPGGFDRVLNRLVLSPGERTWSPSSRTAIRESMTILLTPASRPR